jgi:glycerol-3-phosphate dehydrogenase
VISRPSGLARGHGETMTAAISTKARPEVMDRLERERFDCVIIGGGISGAGIARVAARRGQSVALLEAEDFASGTSGRSSKLIHGGLRYLAMGEVAFVRTAALERKEIHRLAPHLAVPRWTVVPVRSRAGLMKFRAGITTYEKLGAVEEGDLHQNWSGDDLAREEPLLDRSVYEHACAYREYLTDDAHLVLATLRDAAALGAVALNHAPVVTIVREAGVAAGVEAECAFTRRRVRVRARCVINAAGPWVEAVRRLEDLGAPPLLHLSKGVHVVVPAERLPVNHVLILGARDRRSIFAIRHGDVVFIGTTDTTYPARGAVWPEITRDDVEYLLEPLPRYLTCEPVRPSEVVAAWAGLRPLIAEPGKEPHEISRRDEITVGPARVVTLAGGKLTGFRPMARATVEKAAEVCGLDLAPAPAGAEEPLPGGDFAGDLAGLEAALVRHFCLLPRCAARLARLYGSEAHAVARSGTEPLVEGSPVLASEVDWSVRVEGAATVEDVLYRRIRSALFVPEAREASVSRVAARLAVLLGWSRERRQAEVDRARARLEADLEFRG